MTTRITLRRPDDWHLHLRDGAMLQTVLPYSAAQFGRAIVMPNLKTPVTTTRRSRAPTASGSWRLCRPAPTSCR
jgi:dihydroorotase